jgi:alanine dehydrogenase
VLILSAADVAAVLDLDRLADAVEAAMIEFTAGSASMPPRVAAVVPQAGGMLAAMPAYLPSQAALVTKLVSVFPHNTAQPSHQAVICCFDPDTGTPRALMDGTHVTAARTAAASAVATRRLARPDASVVAIIGTGVQASAHARALARLPQVAAIRIAGRDVGKARAVADELRSDPTVGPVEVAESVEAAVRSADIVCATTHSDSPVVRGEWLRPGTHVNAVGYNVSGSGEFDPPTVRGALVVVESRESALAPPPAGAVEIHRAIEAGVLHADDLAELGAICAGEVPGRNSVEHRTVYKSVGIAVQDAAAAALVLAAATAQGIGTELTI